MTKSLLKMKQDAWDLHSAVYTSSVFCLVCLDWFYFKKSDSVLKKNPHLTLNINKCRFCTRTFFYTLRWSSRRMKWLCVKVLRETPFTSSLRERWGRRHNHHFPCPGAVLHIYSTVCYSHTYISSLTSGPGDKKSKRAAKSHP